MNILLIGPQGSGKGTQARHIMENFGLFYFESGEFLRRIAEDNPELKKSLASGVLVPDKEMTSYLTAFFDSKSMYDNVLFDGFPRTVEQYHFFKNWLSQKKVKLDLTIVLEISEKETLRRLSARRMDPETHKIWNLITDPPPPEVDVEKLVHRDDDKPEAIMRRLKLYRERTEPLIEELKKDSEVVEVDGERPIEVIAAEIQAIIQARVQK